MLCEKYHGCMQPAGKPLYYPAMMSSDDSSSIVDGARRRPRVLLVRPTALGDVARTVPALVMLRTAYPDAHIDWLVAEAYTSILQGHPALNGVIPFARKRMGQFWNPMAMRDALSFCMNLRRSKYDLVVDLQGLLRSGIFTRVTGAPRRIGFVNAREGAALAYTEKYALDPQIHTVDRMVGLLAAAGFAPSEDMRLYPLQADVQWVNDYFAKLEGAGDRTPDHVAEPYACIAPTAQWRCKCWPIEMYIRTVKHMLSRPEKAKRVVIIFAPHERAQVQPLLDAFADEPRVVSPSMRVGQMLAMLAGTSMLVCNDSGPLHMAVGLGRRIVSIFGPTDPNVVGPYRRLETVVSAGPVDMQTQYYYRHHREDQGLIAKVTYEQVVAKMEEQWA